MNIPMTMMKMWNRPRDPQRIKSMLRKLAIIWWANPELRLGQLLYNIRLVNQDIDLFYMEDDRLETYLDKELRKMGVVVDEATDEESYF